MAASLIAAILAKFSTPSALTLNASSLLSSAAIKDAALIHISTDYVFNGSKKEPYTENDPLDPQSVYGAIKHLESKKLQRS